MMLYFLCVMLCGQRNFINVTKVSNSLWVNKNGDYPEMPALIRIRLHSLSADENESSVDFKN